MLGRVDDELAKECLHEELRSARASLLGKLDGLSEYDVRRPLTRTGTNLLGLVKHLTLSEAGYFGVVMGRPFPEAIASFADRGFHNRDHMWVAPDETRARVVERFTRACRHADATIDELSIDARGHVPWWPSPDVTLVDVMVHVVAETNRHLGHADILREGLDGALGDDPTQGSAVDDEEWAAHRAKLEHAARAVRADG